MRHNVPPFLTRFQVCPGNSGVHTSLSARPLLTSVRPRRKDRLFQARWLCSWRVSSSFPPPAWSEVPGNKGKRMKNMIYFGFARIGRTVNCK